MALAIAMGGNTTDSTIYTRHRVRCAHMHACFLTPGPPNLGLSLQYKSDTNIHTLTRSHITESHTHRQWTHFPQSSALKHASHSIHRTLLFFSGPLEAYGSNRFLGTFSLGGRRAIHSTFPSGPPCSSFISPSPCCSPPTLLTPTTKSNCLRWYSN